MHLLKSAGSVVSEDPGSASFSSLLGSSIQVRKRVIYQIFHELSLTFVYWAFLFLFVYEIFGIFA